MWGLGSSQQLGKILPPGKFFMENEIVPSKIELPKGSPLANASCERMAIGTSTVMLLVPEAHLLRDRPPLNATAAVEEMMLA
mmetsp:Transcript_9203/g.17897  ORF Transcript_9203/g.17897 Transcript_9203/m.17897 type:complete len:82 (+) Transcript_9203:20-265(+)